MEQETYFVQILLPFSLNTAFTYRVPSHLSQNIAFGKRAVVPFGKNKLYAGLITEVTTISPNYQNIKYILDIIDNEAVITKEQYALWQWMADYYLCTLGEVMAASLPSAFKLAGETQVRVHPDFLGELSDLSPAELEILDLLAIHEQMTLSDIAKHLNIAKIFPVVNSLVSRDILIVVDEIKDIYKPKTDHLIYLNDQFSKDENAIVDLIDSLGKSPKTEKQLQLLLGFVALIREQQLAYTNALKKVDLMQKANLSDGILKTMIKKGIFCEKKVVTSRLVDVDLQQDPETILLSSLQEEKLLEIKNQFRNFDTVLLHGVTGSGKTEMYIKLIDEVLKQGKQVLYLLPEIALTTQIINRLRKFFGHKVGVYHSRFNEYERVEIWNRVLHFDENVDDKYSLILGARSSLLLPYKNLGLIIVDEEHDASYKQLDPAPRYQARDSALILSHIHQCKTLLGTATPSLESYYNVQQKKYGLVELNERFAQSHLPEIWIENVVEARKQKKMVGLFSQFLIDNISEALEKKEQIILFQNRRGYAVRLFCNTCQSMPTCVYCDVTLTYHKRANILKCHYCGYAIDVPTVCPTCHSTNIEMKGFGTEKIEESLAILFPNAVVDRMDMDTTRSRNAYQRIFNNFETQKTDILVGTQMVTKGLDFDRVSVVGILDADSVLSYPDFRSYERAYQLLSQVSGRAGRKEIPGKVIVQTYQPWHPILGYVVSNNYRDLFLSQIEERKFYHYPPVYRLIKITLKHGDVEKVNAAARELQEEFKKHFEGFYLGPEFPLISRVRNYYLKDFWLKLPKTLTLQNKKEELKKIIERFEMVSKYRSVKIVVNVDC